VRHVGQQRAERDDELDAELLRQLDDQLREGAPAEVRLDAEQQHRVSREARRRGVVEGVLRPFDPTRQPLVERDVRSGRLEVDEALRVDVPEPLGVPDAPEVAAGERRALTAVVPAAEGRHEHRTIELGPMRESELAARHAASLEPIPRR
jgi:hypothetical protein